MIFKRLNIRGLWVVFFYMEYLENHRHLWDSFNYMVVGIVPLTSTAGLRSGVPGFGFTPTH